MSDTAITLRRHLEAAHGLRTVVRTMKALAASSIGQYERAVAALADYERAVRSGLGVCLRGSPDPGAAPTTGPVGAVVFGSDQGLVGSFNDDLAAFVAAELAGSPGPPRIWAVGERVHAGLATHGLRPGVLLSVPGTVHGIAPLVGQILLETEADRAGGALHIFHHQPRHGVGHRPARQRLLPLDAAWRADLLAEPWPTRTLPEALGDLDATLRALVGEYLFVSLYRACAESLASENASRLAAMQRAERNIDQRLDELGRAFNRLRQANIDAELFDVIAGFEALSGPPPPGGRAPRS